MVGAIAAVTAVAFVRAYRARRDDSAQILPGVSRDYFVVGLVGGYLAVSAVCWIAALPDYFGAKDGFTPTGARVGSLPFAVAMTGIVVALTVGSSLRTTTPVDVIEPVKGPTAARP